MKRPKLNFIIDIAAFIIFILLTSTGILMRYILPPGSGKHNTIWSFDRHEWGTFHFWISIIFFSILALHLITHWKWIISLLKGRPKDSSGYRVGLGILGLIAVFLLAMAPLLTKVEKASKINEERIETYNTDEHKIKGSMTFDEIERLTKVPTKFLIRSLKLPESTPTNVKLGKLKNEYGFEMTDVRQIIDDYEQK